MDDYDEVAMSDIVEKDINIGSYVEYSLSSAVPREKNTEKYQFSH
ncbi:MAG: hypothetical protein WAW59_06495 [Patescibacteria group bacterium]